jgi:hypothetical protein
MEKVTLQPVGIYSFPNNLSKVPDGSLITASEVVLDKDNIVESRRGQFQYGNVLSVGTGTIDKLISYRSNLICHANGTLYLDSNGSGDWSAYSGTYTIPTGYPKLRAAESNQNLYFTTENGVYKLAEPTATPLLSGMPPGLDGTATTTGTVGFLSTYSNCGYRIVWGYTDVNNNEILGAPSSQIIAQNTAISLVIGTSSGTTLTVSSTAGLGTGMTIIQGLQTAIIETITPSTTITVNGTFGWIAGGTAVAGFSTNVNLQFTIPKGIGTNNFWQIYRTIQVTPGTVAPNDEEQLVAEGNPTSTNITNGYVTYTDTTPDSELEAFLYTNPSQGGILQENNQPPWCTDISVYQGYTFYGNCLENQLLPLTLTAVGGTSGITYHTAVGGTTTNTGTTITNVSSGTTYTIGMRVKGSNIQANTLITGNTGSTLTISLPATGNGSTSLEINDTVTIAGQNYYAAGTTNTTNHEFAAIDTSDPSVDIANASATLINCININPTSYVYAFYLSGFSSLPGEIELQSVGVGPTLGTAFYVTSSRGGAFVSNNQSIPSSGTSLASSQEAKSNYLFYSKYDQPEAVPFTQFIPVGNADFPIQRIIALREALFILKQDGIFYLSGLIANQFTINNLDYTCTIIAPEAAVSINNQVYLMSLQGVVALNSSGVQVVSRAIESQLLQLSSDLYPNFGGLTHAVSYESDRKYILYTVTSPSDIYPTQVFVYNYLTQAWTQWLTPRTCGVINILDDKLYTGNPTNDLVYVERKDFTLNDYADEQYAVSINSSSGYQITLTGTTNVSVGQAISQNASVANILSIGTGNVITVDQNITWSTGSANVFNPIINTVSFNPNSCDSPGIVKKFRELTYFFQQANFENIQVGYTTDFNNVLIYYDIEAQMTGAWGDFAWGTVPWGGGIGGQQVIRTYPTQNNTIGHWLNVNVINDTCFTQLSLQGVTIEYNSINTRQR